MGRVICWPTENNPGEMRFAKLIEAKGSDHLCSFHSLHPQRKETDAVVVDRRRGWIYVVSVKEWAPGWRPADDRTWLKNGNHRDNPYRQNFPKVKAVKERLEGQKSLVNGSGQHQGKLKFSIHNTIAYLGEPSTAFQEFSDMDFFPVTLFADDLDEENMAFGDLDERMSAKADSQFRFGQQIDDEDFQTISKILTGGRDSNQFELATYPHRNVYLDVRGHAGTGKSVSMVERALTILEREPEWSVWVLCANVLMAEYLKIEFLKTLAEREAPESLQQDVKRAVKHNETDTSAGKIGNPGRLRIMPFGGFARLVSYDGPVYDQANGGIHEAFIAALEGFRPKFGFQAVLIDEGQDFTDGMLRALVAHLDRMDTANSLTICRDEWQDIRRSSLSAALQEVLGHTIQVRDLPNKYRSLPDIVRFARIYVELFRNGRDENSYEIRKLFQPEFENSFGREVLEMLGSRLKLIKRIGDTDVRKLWKLRHRLNAVELISVNELPKELPSLIRSIWDLQERARVEGRGSESLNRVAVVYTDRNCMGAGCDAGNFLAAILEEGKIPYHFIATKAGTKHVKPFDSAEVQRILTLTDPHVLLTNIWQIKGLEAGAVLFIGADHERLEEYTDVYGVNYVGMTRGRVLLRVVLQNDNEMAKRLRSTFEIFQRLSK